ncbi:MAG: hypothetical protein M3P32_03690, partial [Chloroflexota bacterium]|nr:hypothetical protein [Chloroflexota bacterium]
LSPASARAAACHQENPLRNRIKFALIAALTLIASQLAVIPVGAAAPQKVVIIVGPTGAQTTGYRTRGDEIAVTAEAAGATVVKVYSPAATWANVKAAVNGANIVVYLGHGNGYPNPYGSSELTDRHNGWGLNRTTSGGDTDNWSTTMVYCGEKALLGTLTSGSAAQWGYCGGSTNTDGITPAANWVMIYSNACYAPGRSEGPSVDVPATESVALQRVRNYSYPGLLLGGGAFFATDMGGGASQLVDTILRNPNMAFGAIAENAHGYELYAQRHFAHPDLSGRRIWIQNTGTPSSGDYKFAYAGRPALTPSGATVAYTEPIPPPIPPQPGSTAFNPPAQVLFQKGTHTGYTFNSAGAVTGTKSFTLANSSGAATSLRSTVPNQSGSWLYVTNGVWAGYWVRETAAFYLQSQPISYPATFSATFSPAASLIFKKGTHTAYQFGAGGVMTAQKTYTLTGNSGASTSQRSGITNQFGAWFYVTNGVWAGYWVRGSAFVYLAGG